MTGALEYAVISFCDDLTDPHGQSTPIGLLGLLREPKGPTVLWLGVISNLEETGLATDPISQHVLGGLPQFLEDVVAEGLMHGQDERMLSWVHHNLRNSLHVSEISRTQEQVSTTDSRVILGRFQNLFEEKVLGEGHFSQIPTMRMKPMHEVSSGSPYEYAV